MTAFGFSITALTLSGPSVPDAHIELTDGLNVITGPSDTGKTFIAQCIDFALGARSRPREIPEASSYDTVRLSLRLRGSQFVSTLQRSFRGGDLLLRTEGEGERTLASKHDARSEDTVSHYLLTLCGLQNKRVRTNQRGTTRQLSFRDLAKLVIVDEEAVISETSPLLTGQVIHKTTESNVFRLLLTGVDDSSVVETPEARLAKSRLEAKVEVIEELRARVEQEIAERRIVSNIEELRARLVAVEATFATASERLAAEQASLSAIEQRRRDAWSRLRRIESRVNVLTELQERFGLLEQQYVSDTHRLETISEAGIRLAQMWEERCPVCGALAQHHDAEHRSRSSPPSQVASACTAEAAKIRTLLLDLQSTRAANTTELARLAEQRQTDQIVLDQANAEIRETLQPRVQEALTSFRQSQLVRDDVRVAIELLERRASLEGMQVAIQTPSASGGTSSPSAAIRTSEAEAFSQEAENVLRAWQFPGLDRVTFSESTQDLVISGRARASHGKGVRAITHAAFNIALMKYCGCRAMPHPGFVVIDSPLVVYREPDAGEDGFSADVKTAFFQSLANCENCQIIIMENEDPPTELDSRANVIRFTGTDLGRRGFIPSGPMPAGSSSGA
jgi:hypothetical protein